MILPTSKGARLSAIAISKSFGTTDDESRQVLANIFNYPTWDRFVSDINANTSPAPLPEQLPSYHEFMMERLSQQMSLPITPYLFDLVKSVSPYSAKPKPLAYDMNSVRSPKSDESLDFAELFGALDMDEAMGSMAEHFREQGMGDIADMMAGGDFADKMRISKPIDPYYYNIALSEVLDWETSQHTESFEHGVPSFYYEDQNGEANPVFLNSASISPGDSGDTKTLNTLLDLISDGYDEIFEKPMLLSSSVQFKEVNGKPFGVIGFWFDGKDWRWLFLSKLKPWEQKKVYPNGIVDNLENALHDIPAELAYNANGGNENLNTIYQCVAVPSEDPSTENTEGANFSFTIEPRPIITGHSGWQIFLSF